MNIGSCGKRSGDMSLGCLAKINMAPLCKWLQQISPQPRSMVATSALALMDGTLC